MMLDYSKSTVMAITTMMTLAATMRNKWLNEGVIDAEDNDDNFVCTDGDDYHLDESDDDHRDKSDDDHRIG